MSDELNELAARLGKEVVPELVPGHNGIFEVRLNGELVYSKAQTGRFPDEGEVAKLLEQQL